MDLMVSVPFVSLYPWANHPSSTDMAFIQLPHRSGSSIIFLYFVIISFVTQCTTLLHDSLIPIDRENRNLESCNAIGIVCGTSANNALPSTMCTVSWEIATVLPGDLICIGWSCFTHYNRHNVEASSSS